MTHKHFKFHLALIGALLVSEPCAGASMAPPLETL